MATWRLVGSLFDISGKSKKLGSNEDTPRNLWARDFWLAASATQPKQGQPANRALLTTTQPKVRHARAFLHIIVAAAARVVGFGHVEP